MLCVCSFNERMMSPGIAGVNNLGTTSRDPENVSRPFALIPLSLSLY